MRLEIQDLSYSYGGGAGVRDVWLRVEPGQFVGLIGPNGSGKSTLLKQVYRALTPDSGRILLDGEDLSHLPFRACARRMAVVGQENEIPFDFTVEEMVAMGRSPHKGLFDPDTQQDRHIVRRALEQLGISPLAGRSYRRLSGGEKQRVLLARALAQECDFLVLDEPTNHLDIRYQMQIFDLLKALGVTVLAAIHDLNLAALYCDRLYVLSQGQVILEGPGEQVLTPDLIHRVYGVRCCVERHPVTGKPSISYLPAPLGA